MATQWGRDSSFQSGGRRGSAGLIIVVSILSLALGFGGGYAAFRYMQPGQFTQQDNNASLDHANTEIADLNAALSVAMKDLEDARAAQAASVAEVEDLQAQAARQAADLDAMTEKLAALSSETSVPEDNTEALEALILERDILAAENETLASNLAALETERDALRQEAAEAEERLAAELARINDQVLPELTAERDDLQRRILVLLDNQSALKAQINAAAQSKAADAERIAELEARLAENARELSDAQEALLAREVEQAEAEVNSSSIEPTARVEPSSETSAMPELEPRDPDAVAAALRSAPGIGLLSADDQRALTERLVSGECVTSALESVFDRVPILTLRNLIRDLSSDC